MNVLDVDLYQFELVYRDCLGQRISPVGKLSFKRIA